ncbi:MAG TPA: 2-oxoacid:acceptor oxidoreductase family protein, partial [Methanomassiliicoccaceae archaeon]|nr:2-oxoacid:acceptor oxidoreductase family protein [Methanomassiliicoccaceae archaeon]
MKYNIQLVGVGGQGVLLASTVLGNAAVADGLEVAMSEVHGMAQRGGSVQC